MWSVERFAALCLSVSMSVSVWEGGYSWLCEVTGRTRAWLGRALWGEALLGGCWEAKEPT